MSKRRNFQRLPATRNYRKLFVIATEGDKTEPQYFALFSSQTTTVLVRCLRSRDESSPPQVLKRMKDYIRDKGLKHTDEAWLVVDKDQWRDDQLLQLHEWSMQATNYGLAVSNPKFELWLLMHFEDATDAATPRQLAERLNRYLPGYDKGRIATGKLKLGITAAIDRARQKDQPSCTDWPRSAGTTVYRLVEKLLTRQG
jgi:hypothetical protein